MFCQATLWRADLICTYLIVLLLLICESWNSWFQVLQTSHRKRLTTSCHPPWARSGWPSFCKNLEHLVLHHYVVSFTVILLQTPTTVTCCNHIVIRYFSISFRENDSSIFIFVAFLSPFLIGVNFYKKLFLVRVDPILEEVLHPSKQFQKLFPMWKWRKISRDVNINTS